MSAWGAALAVVVACVVVIAIGAAVTYFFEDGGLISYLAALAVFGIAAVVFFAVREDEKHRDDVCVRSHQESSTTYIKSGNAMIPMTSTYDVCDQYVPKSSFTPAGPQ